MSITLACRHHWHIAPPRGPTSKGKCLKCGEEGEFYNSREDYGPERAKEAHTMYCTSEKVPGLTSLGGKD